MSRRPNVQARERILEAAFRLVYERGFNAVSMDDVAKAAGIKKANLFHYYPTKEELGVAVFDHAAARMREKMSSRLSGGGDPVRLVDGMFADVAEQMDQDRCRGGCFVGNLAQELSDQSERIRRRVAEHLELWAIALAAALEEAREDGYFCRSFKPRAAADAIIAAYEGAMMLCKARRETKPLQNARVVVVTYLKTQKP